MNKYEAMFILRPDLKDEERNAAMAAIKDQVPKQGGTVTADQVWAERRRFSFDLFPKTGQTRFKEGTYYLLQFQCAPSAIEALKAVYGLNENLLRYLILNVMRRQAASV
jgi:small subunit ribosomal protein S6